MRSHRLLTSLSERAGASYWPRVTEGTDNLEQGYDGGSAAEIKCGESVAFDAVKSITSEASNGFATFPLPLRRWRRASGCL